LGGIFARLDLPSDVHARLNTVIHNSIEYAWAHQEETLPTIKQYAQELDDAVIRPYLDLYVNEHTLDLGNEGEAAIRRLELEAGGAGILQQAVQEALYIAARVPGVEEPSEAAGRTGDVGGVHDVHALVVAAVDQGAVEVESDGSVLHDDSDAINAVAPHR